ncbi:MAG: TIGR03089 family protein [Candidatus Nanopelagicales bacterium]
MSGQFDGAIWPLIQRRARLHSSQPFVTSIDADGFRTELSGTSLSNAVAKTAGALADEAGLEPGARIAMHLPWHWQRVTWTLAAWTVGAVVAVDGDVGTADLVVTDRSNAAALAEVDEPWVVSLHPLGLVEQGLPSTVVDATGLCRMQPDALLIEPATGDGLALELPSGQQFTRVQGADWVRGQLADADARLLIDRLGDDDPAAWLIATLLPLLGSGAVVITDGGDIAAIATQEGATRIWP